MYRIPDDYYHYRERIADGFDKVRYGHQWGVTIARTTSLVVPVKWKGVQYLTNTLWAVTRDNERWGIFSTIKQELIIRAVCDEFYCYNDTRLGIRSGSDWFLFNTTTNCLTDYFGAPLS